MAESTLRRCAQDCNDTVDRDPACMQGCVDFEQACTACADACLIEDTVAELTGRIRTDLDCAEDCEARAEMHDTADLGGHLPALRTRRAAPSVATPVTMRIPRRGPAPPPLSGRRARRGV